MNSFIFIDITGKSPTITKVTSFPSLFFLFFIPNTNQIDRLAQRHTERIELSKKKHKLQLAGRSMAPLTTSIFLSLKILSGKVTIPPLQSSPLCFGTLTTFFLFFFLSPTSSPCLPLSSSSSLFQYPQSYSLPPNQKSHGFTFLMPQLLPIYAHNWLLPSHGIASLSDPEAFFPSHYKIAPSKL